jgi:hypothetical protein
LQAFDWFALELVQSIDIAFTAQLVIIFHGIAVLKKAFAN